MAKPEDKTVLVVDDEEDVRDFFSTLLEDAGFNVQTAENGQVALEMIRERPPDFVSLDLVMPEKSGIRLLYELRRHKEWASIPFVIVTAHAHDDLGRDDLQDILADKAISGPKVHLEKPVKPEHYVRLVCEQLGVECETEEDSSEPDSMRDEIQRLLKSADPDQLARAMRLLKERK
jgi:CheY-like chemotaxis protein